MAVLHALWNDSSGHLHFWIERPPRERYRAGHHPGARGHASLMRTIGAWLGQALIEKAGHARLTLLLPTHGNQPVASPETGLAPPDVAQLRWQAWIVPTLAMPNPSIALRRLARRSLPDGLTLGATAQFWLSASAFVDDLIARQCFAPYAGDADMTILARWLRPCLAHAAPLLANFIEHVLDRRARQVMRHAVRAGCAGWQGRWQKHFCWWLARRSRIR